MIRFRLRFFFEYGGGCLWAGDEATRTAFGYPIDPRKLPFAPETVERLEALEAKFQTSLNWNYPLDPGPWTQGECDQFNAEVAQLLALLSHELGAAFVVVNEQPVLTANP